jgi:hypothetical protein|uniref:Uncharacterized protein n=1 Tax=viral metagenome TaxID=1070528 RepID=A0A6C0IKB3_9ZZZZ
MDSGQSKNVRFHNVATVVLIPSRKDLGDEEGLITNVWWTKEELRKIFYRLRFEVITYAHVKNVSFEDASKKLYGLKW